MTAIFVLVMFLGIDPCIRPDCSRSVKIVSDPDEAAVVLWQNDRAFQAARGNLYKIERVDNKLTISEVPIPLVTIKQP